MFCGEQSSESHFYVFALQSQDYTDSSGLFLVLKFVWPEAFNNTSRFSQRSIHCQTVELHRIWNPFKVTEYTPLSSFLLVCHPASVSVAFPPQPSGLLCMFMSYQMKTKLNELLPRKDARDDGSMTACSTWRRLARKSPRVWESTQASPPRRRFLVTNRRREWRRVRAGANIFSE